MYSGETSNAIAEYKFEGKKARKTQTLILVN